MKTTLPGTAVKIVNMFAARPTDCGYAVPFVGRLLKTPMTIDKIYRCIKSNARVEEVLPDGRIVRLGFDNYNTDNSKKEEPKVVVPTLTPLPAKNGRIIVNSTRQQPKPVVSKPQTQSDKPVEPNESKEESKPEVDNNAVPAQEEPGEEHDQEEGKDNQDPVDPEEEEIRRMIEEDEKNK